MVFQVKGNDISQQNKKKKKHVSEVLENPLKENATRPQADFIKAIEIDLL